jgi:hypothetical protein
MIHDGTKLIRFCKVRIMRELFRCLVIFTGVCAAQGYVVQSSMAADRPASVDASNADPPSSRREDYEAFALNRQGNPSRGKGLFENEKRRLAASAIPTSGGPMAYGSIGPDGGYTLRTAGSDGLIPGDYTATVVAYAKDPWEGITEAEVDQIRLVPARFANPQTSDQRFSIAAGENHCDIRLISR